MQGYSQVDDYLSELAARGSSVAPWAIAAFVSSALAHAAGAYALHRSAARRRDIVGAAALLLAAMAVLAIAGFRLSPSGVGDVLDDLHAASVMTYQAAWVAAVLARGPGMRAVPVAAASTLLLVASLSLGDAAGVLQRAWVMLDQAWLLIVTAIAVRGPQAVAGRDSSPPDSTTWRDSVL